MSQSAKPIALGSVLLLAVLVVLAVFDVIGAGAGLMPLLPNAPVPANAYLEVIITPELQELSPGDTANLQVDIANRGGVAISGISTSGASYSSCNRANVGSLNPGQSTSYTCQKTNVAESSLEVLTVSGSVVGGATYQQTTNTFIKVVKPELRIIKRKTRQTVRPGGTAPFSIVIFNTSNTVLTNIKVIDNGAPDCNLDPAVPITLAPGDSRDYSCKLLNIQSPVTTVATVQGINAANSTLNQASDVAWVDVLNLEAGLVSNPTQVPEPGSEVTFSVTVSNPGSIPVTLVGLNTNKYGNLFDLGNELVPATTNDCLLGPDPVLIRPNGGSVSCSFVAPVSGQPSDFSVVLTALARSAAEEEVSATTNATVKITDVPTEIDLNLSADPPIVSAPGGNVNFTVRISNASEADGVTIDKLEDATLGSLNGRGTCVVPTNLIVAGGKYECSFSDQITGTSGQEKVRTVSASGLNDDPVPVEVSASDTITIPITNRPVQQIMLPNIIDDVVEPNNRCALAYPLQLNRQYYFLPPPTYVSNADPPLQDYFRFVLTDSATVTVELTNFVPRKGQLIVRKGETCDDESLKTPIGRNPDSTLNKTLDLGTQGPGQYFIQIINDGPDETAQYYGLIVKTK